MGSDNYTFYILIFISAIVSLIPLIMGAINFRSLKNFFLPLFILVLVSLLTEVISKFLGESGYSNLDIYHFFTIVEFTLISLFYSTFFRQYFNALLIYILIPVFLIVAYIDYKLNGLNSMDNFSTSVESIILIFYSLFFFYYVLKNLIFENLLSTPVFWLNTAILFYFSGNMILFVFSNHMAETDNSKYMLLWAIIHTFFNVLYNVLLSIGFWKAKTK